MESSPKDVSPPKSASILSPKTPKNSVLRMAIDGTIADPYAARSPRLQMPHLLTHTIQTLAAGLARWASTAP